MAPDPRDDAPLPPEAVPTSILSADEYAALDRADALHAKYRREERATAGMVRALEELNGS